MIERRDTRAHVEGQGKNLLSEEVLVSMNLSNIPGDLIMEFPRKIAVRYSGGANAQ